MPRGDRTGPLGWGPMTGRAAGYCAGYPVPGYLNPALGRGFTPWAGYGDTVPYGPAPVPAGYQAGYAPFRGSGYGFWRRGRGGFGFGRGRGFGFGRGRWGGW
jgi:hypothetical protein